jgi:hypothetical protein
VGKAHPVLLDEGAFCCVRQSVDAWHGACLLLWRYLGRMYRHDFWLKTHKVRLIQG